jgi:putative YhdH/YhfP family quinone oxidoreductase
MTFRAFVAEQRGDTVDRGVRELDESVLPAGDVTIRVAYSSVNYKDALATIPKGRVARISPLIPGIDLAGEVIESSVDRIVVGERVLAHGYDLGVAHHGGYAELARVPADWVVPLPVGVHGLTPRQAMAVGTAGFTAATSIHLLEEHGLHPGRGPVLVTGASGGVGSVAVAILAHRGYEVVASTGKANEHDYLRRLGAREVLTRSETSAESPRPLESERWAGAVDCVGGTTLAYVLRTLRYGGAVAASGLTGGTTLATTVMPFILRGVSLLGVDSVQVPIDRRRVLWHRIAADLRPPGLDNEIAREIGLAELPDALDAILRGQLRGRTVVRVS